MNKPIKNIFIAFNIINNIMDTKGNRGDVTILRKKSTNIEVQNIQNVE